MAQAKTKTAEENGHDEANAATGASNVTPIKSTSDLPEALQPDPNYVPTYEFRRLHSGDTLKIWRWVRAAQAEDTIRDAVMNGGPGAAQYAVIDVLMDKVEDEVMPWLYDMAGLGDKSEEELDADAPIAVIADLANHADFLRVFNSASRVSHAIKRISSLFAMPEVSQDQEQSGEDTQTPNF